MKLIRKCEQWLKLWATADASDEKVSTAQNQVKKALIQTYFTSLLCLVLCVTMFLGTTYAWFASEVNNEGNEIYVGVLKVGLLKETADKDGDGKPDLADLAVEGNKLFDNTIRWEPGFTALETVQIVNLGDLAFKYVMNFTDGTLDEEEDTQNPGGAATQTADENATGTQNPGGEVTLADVAQYFDVWVYDHQKNDAYIAPESYDDIDEANGWTSAGTLAQVLDGEAVLSGTMNAVRKDGQAANAVNEGTTDGVSTEHRFTIALHMQKTAGAEVMGQKISLNVKLVGYQMTKENDGFGNNGYDDINFTYVTNAEALREAVNTAEDGDIISVAAGTYDFTENPLVINKGITLQGADPAKKPELQFVTTDGTSGAAVIGHGIEIKSDDVTLKNLKLTVDPDGRSEGNAVQISYKSADSTEYYSDILIDGCEIYGSDHSIAMYGDDVTIQNCILDESTADDQGNIIYVWGTSGKLTIRNNQFVGNNKEKHGISFYYQSTASSVSGDILIEGNTFDDVYKGIVHESDMTYTDVSVEILNNTFTDNKKEPVAIDNGKYLSYKVNGNVFLRIEEPPLVDNGADAVVNADENYWGTNEPAWSTVLNSSKVTVSTYYKDAEKTILYRRAN